MRASTRGSCRKCWPSRLRTGGSALVARSAVGVQPRDAVSCAARRASDRRAARSSADERLQRLEHAVDDRRGTASARCARTRSSTAFLAEPLAAPVARVADAVGEQRRADRGPASHWRWPSRGALADQPERRIERRAGARTSPSAAHDERVRMAGVRVAKRARRCGPRRRRRPSRNISVVGELVAQGAEQRRSASRPDRSLPARGWPTRSWRAP